MNYRTFFCVALVAVAVLAASPSALACADGKACNVDRTCEKIDNGYRCTILAKGDTEVAKVRECVRSCSSKDCKLEGVKVTIEDVDGGVVVTRTTDDPEKLKQLQALAAAGCSKDAHHSGCTKDKAHAAHDCGHKTTKKCCSKGTSA